MRRVRYVLMALPLSLLLGGLFVFEGLYYAWWIPLLVFVAFAVICGAAYLVAVGLVGLLELYEDDR